MQPGNESALAVTSSTQHTVTSQSSTEAKADLTIVVGTVARVEIDDNDREKHLNDRLHFCVFENGKSDYINVGTKSGIRACGRFDLTINGENIFTGDIGYSVYEGVIIQLGDVLSEQIKSKVGVHITCVTVGFKKVKRTK